MKKTKASILLLSLLFYLSLSCDRTAHNTPTGQNTSAANQDSLQKVIVGKATQYYADMSDRDWEAYASHFWPGAHLTTVWQPTGSDSLQVVMTTIEEFIQQADQGPGSQPIFEEKMLDAKVRVYKNLASVWATYQAKFGTKDSLMQWQGIDAFTFIKHNNQWRISSLSYTSMED